VQPLDTNEGYSPLDTNDPLDTNERLHRLMEEEQGAIPTARWKPTPPIKQPCKGETH
jgi:hypothetical protein